MFKSNFYRMVPRQFVYQGGFFALLALLLFAETAWTQTITKADEILRDRITATRQKIDTAASWHATDDQLGLLWLQVASDYADEFDFQRSEEAFAHSLKLLRTSPEQKHYAAALDSLGSVYLVTDRLKESESCRRKALAIYEGFGDKVGASQVRIGLSIALVHEHRFAESEEESAKALKSLQEQKDPNKYVLVNGLLSSSYAKCFQGRCDEGLIAASQAMTLVRAMLPKDSLVEAAALMVLGFEKWKTGDEAEGEKAMREALVLLRQETNMPYAKLVDAQLKVLTGYTSYLKATHQKAMAKQIENEMARLKGEQPPSSCKDCTVNAVALSMNKRQE
jgi:tetratricopeptide (TPR) repeat protein